MAAQLVGVLLHRGVQLAQALHAERVVGRPVVVVERAASRRDRRVHVRRPAIGGHTDHLFGGRVDVLERGAVRRVDELAVDQQSLLVPQCVAHASPVTGARPMVPRRAVSVWDLFESSFTLP